MWSKLIDFFKRMFFTDRQRTTMLSDEEVEKEIKKKEQNLQLLHEIISSNPLKQIDWIIENGYEKFIKLYKSYEEGSIRNNLYGQTDDVAALSFSNIGYSTEDFANATSILFQKTEEKRIKCYSNGYGALVFTSKEGAKYVWEKAGNFQYVKPSDLKDMAKYESFFQYIEVENDRFTIDLKTASEFHSLTIGHTKGTKEEKELDVQLKQALSKKDYKMYSGMFN